MSEQDELIALAKKWQEAAEWEIADGSPEFGKGLDQCADELLAALTVVTPQHEEKKEDQPRMDTKASPVDSLTASGDGARSIAAERYRQLSVEGWTFQHDDAHANYELTLAAISYAMYAATSDRGIGLGDPPKTWPWERSWWKPDYADPIPNLVKAGALIAAEIDRLQRHAVAKDSAAPVPDSQPVEGRVETKTLNMAQEATILDYANDDRKWTTGETTRANLRKLVREILAMPPAHQETETGWQPIDTAPKDGRRVMLYGCEYRRHWFGTGYWFQGVPGDGEGWISHSFYTSPVNDSSGTFTATHWRPMFAPPLSPQASGADQ